MKMMRIIDEEIDQTHQHFNLNAVQSLLTSGRCRTQNVHNFWSEQKKTPSVSIKLKGKKTRKLDHMDSKIEKKWKMSSDSNPIGNGAVVHFFLFLFLNDFLSLSQFTFRFDGCLNFNLIWMCVAITFRFFIVQKVARIFYRFSMACHAPCRTNTNDMVKFYWLFICWLCVQYISKSLTNTI